MATAQSTAPLAFPALLVGSAVLAFGPLLVRLADVSPMASAFWRMGLAAPVLVFMALMSGGRRPPTSRAWWWLALAGVFFAADIAVWHAGIVRTSLANATLFGNVSSFFFAAYGFVLVRALPGMRFTAALVAAGLGVALLLGRSFELSPRHFTGDLLCILAAVLYTGYLVVMDRVRAYVSPVPALAVATVAGAAALLPLALFFGQPVWPQDWTPVVLLALGSQVLGQGLIIYAVGHLKPEVSGIGLLIQPVVAAVIGWVALGETLGPVELLGGLVVLGALVVARWPDRRAVTPASEPLG